jgi:hypothetical protein
LLDAYAQPRLLRLVSVGITNYDLQRAQERTNRVKAVRELTLREGLRAGCLMLWDEEAGRLVSSRDGRRPVGASV